MRLILALLLALICSSQAHAFHPAGEDQRTVDLTLRPNAPLNPEATTAAGRTRVDCKTLNEPGALLIPFIGQSTNNGAVAGTYAPVNGSKIFNLSIAHRGACFVAQEPLLSSDLLQGHHGMELADMLLSDGVVSKVILVNISLGGSNAADWVPGGGVHNGSISSSGVLAYRIGLAARAIANAGLWNVRTIIDLQNGEWDTDAPNTPQATFAAQDQAIVAEFKRVGLLRAGNVMFVHLNTRLEAAGATTAARTAIRAAQASIPDGILVLPGADIDTIPCAQRDSSCTHEVRTSSPSGAATQAALKKAVYESWLSGH